MSRASGETMMMPMLSRPGLALRLGGGWGREWGWLFGMAAVDLLWCWRIGMSFSNMEPLLLVVSGLMLACLLIRCARLIPGVADACEVVAFWIAFSLASCILTYLFATWSLAPYDRAFDGLDVAMGFDWRAWADFVTAHKPLERLLALAYASLRLQLLLAILFLALTGQRKRNRLLLRSTFILLVVASAISGLVPALGAFSFYGRSEAANHLHALSLLRDGGEWAFTAGQLKGIVTMPSCHAAFAVILILFFARRSPVGILVVAWNLLMLVSVLSEGGHYLVDAIAGGALALLAMRLAQATLTGCRRDIPDVIGAPIAAAWR